MQFKHLTFQDKFLYCLIVIYCLFLAYSEALKNIAVYLMIFYFLFNIILGRVKISINFINLSVMFHLAVVSIGIWLGINYQESLNQYMDVIHIALIFLFFREANLNFLSYERIIQLIFIGFSLAVFAGMYLLFSSSLHRLELHSVGSINRSAVYIMYVFVTALCLFDQYKEKKLNRLFFLFVIILSTISLLLGASRMAIFSLPLVIIFYLILAKKLKLKIITLLSLMTILILSILYYFNPESFIITKIAKGFNDPHRIQIWEASVIAWTENNLWFGIGVGNSIFIDVSDYFNNKALTTNIDNTHNLYLDMLLERGLFGLMTFLGFMYSFFFIKEKNTNLRVFIRLLVFSLLLMGFANITFRYEFALLFVTLLGSYLNPSIKK